MSMIHSNVIFYTGNFRDKATHQNNICTNKDVSEVGVDFHF